MPKNKTEADRFPTRYEYFLYLLFELERAVERGGIDWPAAESAGIRARLARIAEKVAQPSRRGDGTSTH
jgi:hypothetical protein